MKALDTRASLFLALAFALGGVSGFFVAKKLLEEHYRELAQMEIDEVKAYFEEKYEGAVAAELSEAAEEGAVTYRKLAKDYGNPPLDQVIGRAKVISQTEDELVAEVEIDEDFKEEMKEWDSVDNLEDEEDFEEEEDSPDGPYLISYEDFLDEELEYEKIDLFYYRFDEVMCTVEDVVVLDPQDILGWDWEQRLERMSTAFVRDDELETDYEIHALSKSYNDEVAIRLETKKEKELRRKARQKEAMDTFSESPEYEEVQRRKPKTKPYVRPKNNKINYHNISSSDEALENVEVLDE